jgi:hypothetical protein
VPFEHRGTALGGSCFAVGYGIATLPDIVPHVTVARVTGADMHADGPRSPTHVPPKHAQANSLPL